MAITSHCHLYALFLAFAVGATLGFLGLLIYTAASRHPDTNNADEVGMAAKDFGPIESDYAFFMAHATEAESDTAEYARRLTGFADERTTIRMLDFGCGGGDFTERFLSCMSWVPGALELTLVEPVGSQLKQAARSLARFSDQPIVAEETLPAGAASRFDLILSNHVLYYVDNLEETLRTLVAALAPRGKLLLAIAGWDNRLMELWTAGFAILGQRVPFHAAEEVAAALSRLGLDFQKSRCSYRLRFPDSPENRLRILRFLFADHLQQLPAERLLSEFDRHVQQGHVDLTTHSEHFAVQPW